MRCNKRTGFRTVVQHLEFVQNCKCVIKYTTTQQKCRERHLFSFPLLSFSLELATSFTPPVAASLAGCQKTRKRTVCRDNKIYRHTYIFTLRDGKCETRRSTSSTTISE